MMEVVVVEVGRMKIEVGRSVDPQLISTEEKLVGITHVLVYEMREVLDGVENERGVLPFYSKILMKFKKKESGGAPQIPNG